MGKIVVAWVLLIFSIASTPLALFWFAKNEPPFIVILSELALIYTALDAIWHAQEIKQREDNGDNDS